MSKERKTQDAKQRRERVHVDLGSKKTKDILASLAKAKRDYPGAPDTWFVVEGLRLWLTSKGYRKVGL